jgi:hypothetical protein
MLLVYNYLVVECFAVLPYALVRRHYETSLTLLSDCLLIRGSKTHVTIVYLVYGWRFIQIRRTGSHVLLRELLNCVVGLVLLLQ